MEVKKKEERKKNSKSTGREERAERRNLHVMGKKGTKKKKCSLLKLADFEPLTNNERSEKDVLD